MYFHTIKKRIFAAAMILAMPICSSCVKNSTAGNTVVQAQAMTLDQMPSDLYRSYYEIFPYSYADSNHDGIGDLNGITKTLDYINDGDPATDTDLGLTGIWLTPIMPSPTYHKYDAKDYMNIDPQFGTLDDFDALMTAAHQRGINVIIDLVINHTSVEHPWFQQAAAYLRQLGDGEPSAADCPYFDYYHFSREQKNDYHQLSGTNWYYDSHFWEGMPDLNLDSDAVWNEITAVTSFWLSHKVDGFRLDAAKEYYSGNDEANIKALTRLNTIVKNQKKDAYIVAEVWADRAVYAPYYASGINSVFDFAFAGDDGNIARLLKQSITASQYGGALMSEESMYASYNADYINAPFYTNHDMARSAGYYTGDNAMNMVKFAHALNLLQGGASFTYYGDEIGMKGAGIDENKRAPMNWGDGTYSDLTCKGAEAMDQNIDMIYGTLADQMQDDSSIYHFYCSAVKMRNLFPQIARGTTDIVSQDNENVCLMTKETEEDGSISIAFNPTSEVQKLSTDAVKETLPDDSDLTKAAYILTASQEDIKLNQGELELPAYSVVVYK